jgi:uncharacterized membrane protein YjfL (UPF0719 family)
MPAYQAGFAVVTTVVLLVLFQIGQRLLGPEHTIRKSVEKDNTARSILQVGHVLGIFLISTSVVTGCVVGDSVATDALWVAAFGGASVVLLAITGSVGVRMLMASRLPAELERGNVAAGLAAASHYAATGYVIARNINGTNLATLGISLIFFVIAQITLHLVVTLFRALTTYDDSEEILGENLAAALSYAGLTMGVGILVGHATEGTFAGWGSSLKGYGLALLLTLVLYPVRQFLVQTVLLGAPPTLRAGRLDEGVGRERNVGMGALEAVAYVATALLISRIGA